MAEYLLSSNKNKLHRECGNMNNPDMCRYILGYSPYHIDVPENLKSQILLLADNDDFTIRQHSYKFAAKLRDEAPKNTVILKNLVNSTENEKYANALAFMIKSLYKPQE